MRRGAYPGSDIVIQQELSPGTGNRRYLVSYLSQGLRINALLVVPTGAPPAGGWPGVVFNHGYIPPTEYRTGRRYVAYVDRIARAGYIVLQPDYRGHDQSEGLATGGMGHPGYVIDVLNATASLRRYAGVNARRIGMWGHSMGGYIALRAMVIDQDIKAGVIWAGVVASYPDLLSGWRRDRPTPAVPATPYPYARDWRGWSAEFGTPDENPAFWSAISANSYLADLSGPLQLQHGTADASVPLTFTLTLNDQLLAAGKTVELYLYEGDDHNISAHLAVALDRSVAFFDRYVRGPAN
jgi:dipeptidyl aminopeptidase/acylaminoacyl peptidase